MTRTEVTLLIDDLDGSQAHHTVTFAFRERRYEIDLSTDNAEAFFNLLLPYIEAGRPARPDVTDAQPSNIDDIRKWARANGFSVSERGRIAHRVRSAFYESQRNPGSATD